MSTSLEHHQVSSLTRLTTSVSVYHVTSKVNSGCYKMVIFKNVTPYDITSTYHQMLMLIMITIKSRLCDAQKNIPVHAGLSTKCTSNE